jgi:hypothetical protein
LKPVQERAGTTLELVGIGNDFINRTQMAQQLENKWDYMKLKSFCPTKEMVTRLRDSPQNGRKFLTALNLTRD